MERLLLFCVYERKDFESVFTLLIFNTGTEKKKTIILYVTKVRCTFYKHYRGIYSVYTLNRHLRGFFVVLVVSLLTVPTYSESRTKCPVRNSR